MAGRRLLGLLPAGWQETSALVTAGWQETKKSPASWLAGDLAFGIILGRGKSSLICEEKKACILKRLHMTCMLVLLCCMGIYCQSNRICMFSQRLTLFFSDPPLEEDDVPTGEWVCHKCKVSPKVEVSSFCIFKGKSLISNK